MKRTQRSELFMGVLIGFYGNWLIQLLEKMKGVETFHQLLLLFSFIPLFVYFWIAFSDVKDQIRKKLTDFKVISGFSHFLFIVLATGLGNIMIDEMFFIFPGIIFWLSLLIVEFKGLIGLSDFKWGRYQ